MKIEFEGEKEELYEIFPNMKPCANAKLDPNASVVSMRDILTAKSFLRFHCEVTRRCEGCQNCWFVADDGKTCFFKTFYPFEWDKWETEKKHKEE